ncbi:DUF4333 domain-containing protein [Mycolicibacillus koreensis]|nr:DUF4333 domain-containing protein [Mycolicibacillus koreensis]BBY53403.1 hypothetical protein MKOR_06540 [Mycolicibacillus koreensis]
MTMRMTGSLLSAVLLAPLAGCSLLSSSGGPDYGKLESAIHDKLVEEYAGIGHEPSEVTCPRPKETPKAGEVFVCTTHVDGNDDLTVHIEVTAGDDGRADFKTVDTLYDLPDAAEKLGTQISEDQGFAVTVDCGQGVKVVAEGDSFECTATDPAGQNRTVKVTAGPVDKGDTWELLP